MMILSKLANPTRMENLLSEGEMGDNLRSTMKLKVMKPITNNDTLLTWNHQSPSANDVKTLIMLGTTTTVWWTTL